VSHSEAASSARNSPVTRPGKRPLLLPLALGALAALIGIGIAVDLRLRADQNRRSAGQHASRGLDLRDAGNRAGALSELERATHLDPRNGQAWYLLGHLREEIAPGSGLDAYAQAVKYDPGSAKIRRDYGLALHEAGRTLEARVQLDQAVELAPTDQEAYADLGRAYASGVRSPADVKKALDAFRTALSLQPGDVQTRFRLARLLYQEDRLDPSRREFETTLSLLAAGARASKELMDGRSVQSVTWLSIVKGCHHHLAQITVRQKRPEVAAHHQRLFQELERYIRQTYNLFEALKARPDDASAKQQLADLYIRFGLPAKGPDGASAVKRWIG
jgi:Tfp pilus assembly protein PilF